MPAFVPALVLALALPRVASFAAPLEVFAAVLVRLRAVVFAVPLPDCAGGSGSVRFADPALPPPWAAAPPPG
ncbi:hypothetical protein ABTF77_20830, partial [Acinetobacter baumannii]